MNPSILRILDANLNRAREALRVVEDYARFHLDNATLCGELKQLRHDLSAATSAWTGEAILHRDTPGDVGTATKTATENVREDLSAVVTAAGKRLGEALRTIEEYLKTQSPPDAAKVELIRYHFYDVEMRIARTLRPTSLFATVQLYVLITESACKRPWMQVAEAAIAGGADCLQLREKTLEAAQLLRRAKELVALCRRQNALCIINDRPDIAVLAGADGVHLGQTDLPAIEARKILGNDKIVGVSTHNLEQARQALLDGADYIGVGPIFRSPTKPREFVAGPEFAREAAKAVRLPTVAVAGITEQNIEEVMATGVNAVAVTAAIAGTDDPERTARRLKQTIIRARVQSVGQTFLSAQNQPSEPSPIVPVTGTAQHGGADILVCPNRSSEREFHSYSRRLPHWRLEGATYFVTFRVLHGELRPAERTIILDHMREGDPKYYSLYAAVVMPDHAHMIARPAPGVELSRIIKGTKGASARKVNEFRGSRGNVWQDECWDRILRDQTEFDEKLEYCMNNSVKKGLVTDPWDYPWWYYKPCR